MANEQVQTTRQALEQSIAQLEAGDTTGTGAPNNGLQDQPGSTQGQQPAGQPATGQPAPAQDAGQQPAPAGQQPAPTGQQPGVRQNVSQTDTPPQVSARIAGNLRPPQAWKPELRPHFSTLPPEVQVEITRREREMAVAMQDTAQARQFVEEFQRVAEPYRHIMALEGDNPISSFGNYLRTASILRSGSVNEKAVAVAQAIRQYGIDIQALDGALTAMLNGQMPAQPQQRQPQMQQPAPDQYRDPRLDQLLQLMQQREQQDAQVMAQDVQGEIDTFAADPKNEFFAEVAQDVGDILRLAADRGMAMDLPTAYSRACQLHPRVSQILTQRAQSRQPTNIAAARAAASSLPANVPPTQQGQITPKNTTVRGAIEAAIEQLGT